MTVRSSRPPMSSGPEVLGVLKRARARVVQGWCKGALARDEQGYSVGERDESAVAWDHYGAIWADEADNAARRGALLAFRTANRIDENNWAWGDAIERTKSQVLEAFDTAIAHVVAEGARRGEAWG